MDPGIYGPCHQSSIICKIENVIRDFVKKGKDGGRWALSFKVSIQIWTETSFHCRETNNCLHCVNLNRHNETTSSSSSLSSFFIEFFIKFHPIVIREFLMKCLLCLITSFKQVSASYLKDSRAAAVHQLLQNKKMLVMRLQERPEDMLWTVWPDVKIKRSPNLTTSSTNGSHSSFYLKGMLFKVAQKVHFDLGYLSEKMSPKTFKNRPIWSHWLWSCWSAIISGHILTLLPLHQGHRFESSH